MRLFTAFELPDAVRAELRRLQADMRHLPFRRWQSPATLHVTLHFLSELAPDMLEGLEAALSEGCRGFGDFRLALADLGGFPSLRRPRTLWVGLGGDRDRLAALEARLRPRMQALGIPLEDRPYRPHITLARDPTARTRIPEIDVPAIAWQARELVLFKSTLQAGGAIHTPLARFPLA